MLLNFSPPRVQGYMVIADLEHQDTLFEKTDAGQQKAEEETCIDFSSNKFQYIMELS